jgi:hypothetical protein
LKTAGWNICVPQAYTHNFALSQEREKETEQTLKMMFDLGYVKPEEVPQIPRLAKAPVAIVYAPLGDALAVIASANAALNEYAAGRRSQLATI